MDVLEAVGPRRAVVVVAHGLNVRPDAMRELYEPLRSSGATIVRIALRGHAGADDRDVWGTLTADDWYRDWQEAVRTARALAIDVPLTFLGFSLGCIVHLAALATRDRGVLPFTRQVLIAPPIEVHRVVRLVQAFRIFGGRFRLPSFTPKAIRAQQGTTVAAYEALFAVQRQLIGVSDTTCLRIPTLLVLDPRDELVSYGRVLRWAAHHRLTPTWDVLTLRAGKPAPAGLHHDMIDERSLGPVDYAAINERIAATIFHDGTK
ncbi:MAG: alpha/beta hydrolase [Gemmatimonadaceae bacterium]